MEIRVDRSIWFTDKEGAPMRPPLNVMRIRRNSSHNLYGKVRVGGTPFQGGWNLAARPMTPVYAVADGTVTWIQFLRQYGHVRTAQPMDSRCVLLQLDGQQYCGKQLFAFYAYLSHVNLGEKDHVLAGQQIGLTGVTGSSPQYRENTLNTVAQGVSSLQGLGGSGNYGLVLNTNPYADLYQALPTTLIEPELFYGPGFSTSSGMVPNAPPYPTKHLRPGLDESYLHFEFRTL
jgi:murein DD-endopeptidase MepM/ murein hydrolase activator NlpD